MQLHRAQTRVGGWIAGFALLCALAFFVQVGLAQARADTGSAVVAAEAYLPGPVDARPSPPLELPRGAEELLGLSVLAGIGYGLRASALGRRSRSS